MAAPVLTLGPVNGAIAGTPGSTVGWGFTLSSHFSHYLSAISSMILTEDNPTLGFYQDNIGAQGGPSGGVLEPGEPAWSQDFDIHAGRGLGFYMIDPGAPIGGVNSGRLLVQIEVFSDNPLTCGSCLVDTLEYQFAFSVTAVEPIPEPSTGILVVAGVAAAFGLRRRQRRVAG
jgi:hypothetical protein